MATKKTPAPKPAETAAKPAARKPVVKPAVAAKATAAPKAVKPAAAKPAPVAETVVGDVLKLKELVDTVSAASGAKKKEARELVEATLAALGTALTSGKELNLPGIGRVRVVKTLEKDNNSRILTAKIRIGGDKNSAGSKEALALPGEDE